MSDETRYNIIREQGEFMEPVMLNDDENLIVLDADDNQEEE